ncbi:flagellar hook-associated protein FlgK [Dechloromonas hortensis]|uniref:flagellar hook-associated protein FlgK n=1 Tax=Dechloromonas hortensis TaxID=337779 RepID=UPI0014789F08|nr:flagellar hook-associated protein FlgK [Dechloromonas hortensis]
MGSGLISIAMTGINAAQTGLLTTSNNIANMSAEGYTRQRIVQASNPTVMTGAGGIGQGTHVVTVERMYNQALNKQVLSAQTSVSSLDTYYSQISQIDNMLADKDAGITPLMQQFFNGIQSVVSTPSLISSRQSMISAAETMVTGFQSMYSRLAELEAGVNSQISSTVESINSYTKEIAGLNQRIISASALNGQPANDLLDKRDELVSKLNELVKVTTTTDTNGSYNVFVGSGQQLVIGTRVTEMVALNSSADQSRIVVGLKGATGNVQELPESLVTGGQLGGLLSFRTEALDTAFNQLGLMATSLALTFNAQHDQGLDLDGNAPANDFFSISDPTVIGKSTNSGTLSATWVTPPPNNGTNFYTNVTASDYQLSYDGTNYTLKRLSDNQSWVDSSFANINTQAQTQGFSLSGAPASGDSFTIQPTKDIARLFSVNATIAANPKGIAAASVGGSTGAEDGSNALKLGNLQIQNTTSGGKATFQDNYAAFVNDIGNKTASAEISSEAQTALYKQAYSAKEAVSGVNRDEEAAKLIEYQQAYQASAKVLEIASSLFDTLLAL